jgi:aminoglycoside 6'-N-acetyltransferase I
MQFEIVNITPQNLSLLDKVAVDVFDDDINPEFLASYLKQPHHQLFVAVANGEVVGQVRGTIHFQPDEPQHLYVDNLGVTPNAKRQGIASALFKALVDWGKTKGCKTYWVATECDNDEGNGFYQKLGLNPQKMYFYESD